MAATMRATRRNATARVSRYIAMAVCAACIATPLRAQRTVQSTARSRAAFLGGAAVALIAHEAGHATFDLAFGAHPYLHTVHFGGIPFFAVAQRDAVSPREEYIISSAGFWMQHAANEWMLTAHPNLRREHRPFMKGMFAFNVLLSGGYAVSSFFKAGPAERDPRSMAAGIDVSEPAIGALILAPAALDAYRYMRPDATWAAWASRAIKLGSVALLWRGARE